MFRAALLIASLCSTTHAATITVNNTSGNANVLGSCVLRDAITAANTNAQVASCAAGSSVGADIIVLPAGGVITLSVPDNVDGTFGPNGLPAITSSIEVHGNGATIERSAALACNRNGSTNTNEFRLMLVRDAGNVDLRDVTLRGGCSDGGTSSGGAILVAGTTPTTFLRRVTLTDNYAGLGGGGIFQGGGALTIEYSTIAYNDGGSFGGSAIVAGAPGQGQRVALSLYNSTISGNAAGSIPSVFGNGSAVVDHTTIAHNLGVRGFGYTDDTHGVGTIVIKSSIVADNAGGNCQLQADSLSVQGKNLSSDATCAGFIPSNTAAHLAPLAKYGGPTQTHGLLANSPAIDLAPDCLRPDSTLSTDDQRGVSRPRDGNGDGLIRCDIGAVEYDRDLIFVDSFD